MASDQIYAQPRSSVRDTFTAKLDAARDAKSLPTAVHYRIYTESCPGNIDLVSQYFRGATINEAVGLWNGVREESFIVDVIGTSDDMQRIVFLADALKVNGNQSAVLVEWFLVRTLTV